MSPKIKSVEYLAEGAGTVFDPPTNDLIYILYVCRTCFYVYPVRNRVRYIHVCCVPGTLLDLF
jgi:hypothetical protein